MQKDDAMEYSIHPPFFPVSLPSSRRSADGVRVLTSQTLHLAMRLTLSHAIQVEVTTCHFRTEILQDLNLRLCPPSGKFALLP